VLFSCPKGGEKMASKIDINDKIRMVLSIASKILSENVANISKAVL